MTHSTWLTTRHLKTVESPETEAERAAIRLSMAFAKVVYDRRVELGLSQLELAERTGLTQAKISRIEGSDTVPTLPLIWRLAKALDGSLTIAVDAEVGADSVTFSAHRAA